MATTPPPVSPSAADAEWFRWVENNLELNRVNIKNADTRAAAASQKASVVGAQTAAQEQALAPKKLTAERPFGLMITRNEGVWLPDGTTIAAISLQWEQVTTAIDGTVAMANEYEVWHSLAGAEYTRITAAGVPTASFVLPTNVEVTFIVRARTTEGLWSEMSDPVATLTALPPAITAAPTAPVAESALGTVAVTWDGLLTSGAPGPELWHVYAEEAALSTGPWVRVGQPLNGAGSINVTPPVGEMRWYRLIAVDKLARESSPSASDSVVVAGVDTGDLDAAVSDAIADAQSTADSALTAANGKNKVYYQAAAPSGGSYQTGDTWFDTDDNYKMYVRTPGGTWQLAQDSATAQSTASGAASTAGTALSTANSKVVTFIQSATPTALATGDLWIDTGNGNLLKRWSGSAWVDARDTTIAAAQTTANNALTAANGKNKVYYQDATPGTTGNTTGDTWFDTNDGNKIYRWSGSDWVASELGTNALANLAITNAKIADGTIQNAKIGNLDAGKITTGFINSARIEARSITADKMILGDTSNSAPDPKTEHGLAQWGGQFTITNVTGASRSTKALELPTGAVVSDGYNIDPIPVEGGSQWYVEAEVYKNGTGTHRLGLQFFNDGRAAIGTPVWAVESTSQVTWAIQGGSITAPSDAAFARIFVQADNVAAAARLIVTGFVMRRMASGELIVDGAITTGKIAAGSITAASGIIADAAITTAKIADAQVTNAKIADLAVTNAKIADATIASAKIAALDAGKITTGLLAADRIGANTITVSKLLVANLNNMLMDPGFEYVGDTAWNYQGGAVSSTTAPRSGTRHLSVSTGSTAMIVASQRERIAVQPGETYHYGAWVRLASGNSANQGIALRFRTSATPGGALTTQSDLVTTPNSVSTTYTYIYDSWTVPAGVYWILPDIVVRDSPAGKTYYVDDVALFKMASAELIVDGAVTATKVAAGAITTTKLDAGAVTAEKIAAGTIEANNLSPSVGSSLDISANGSINILVGQTSANAESLTSHQDLIEGLESDVNGVGGVADLAAEAAASAQTAQTTADAAATTAADASATVQELGQTYRFTVDGAFVGAPDSPYEFVIQNTGAEIRYNGVAVTKWDSGQMQVGNFLGESITIGQHKLERYGTAGGTVLRYVG